jgi:transcriptional regulator with XRE-family HTH domain
VPTKTSFQYQALGIKIQDFRILRGFSQVQFAIALHTSQSQVSSWERGIYRPSRKFIPRILSTLKITFADIPELERKSEKKVSMIEVRDWRGGDLDPFFDLQIEEMLDFCTQFSDLFPLAKEDVCVIRPLHMRGPVYRTIERLEQLGDL